MSETVSLSDRQLVAMQLRRVADIDKRNSRTDEPGAAHCFA